MKKLLLSYFFLVSCNLSDNPQELFKPDASIQKDGTKDKNQDAQKDTSKDLQSDPLSRLCSRELEIFCPNETPFCDDSGKCVPCTSDDMCEFGATRCVDGECVRECEDDRPCSDGQFCDPSSHSCVMCLKNLDCQTDLPRCEAGVCVAACNNDAQCSVDRPLCIDANCVECADAADCGLSAPRCVENECKGCESDSDCPNRECSASGSCTVNPKGQCGVCGGDEDCKFGYHCIRTIYGNIKSNQCLKIKNGNCPELYRFVIHRKSVSASPAVDHCGFNEMLVTCRGAGDFYSPCSSVGDCEESASCLNVVNTFGIKQCTHQCASPIECPTGIDCRLNYCRNAGPR